MKHHHDENMEEQPSFSTLLLNSEGRGHDVTLKCAANDDGTDANVCLAGGEGAKTNKENTEASTWHRFTLKSLWSLLYLRFPPHLEIGNYALIEQLAECGK